jgi:hypothetical protein
MITMRFSHHNDNHSAISLAPDPEPLIDMRIRLLTVVNYDMYKQNC